MSVHQQDALAGFLDLVRTAAREGAAEAFAQDRNTRTQSPAPFLDKAGLAHALKASPATIDRLCRKGLIPFILVGSVKRFDLEAVRATLRAGALGSAAASRTDPPPAPGPHPVDGPVRLLSRGRRG